MQQWITIRTFTYPHEAYIVQGKLESEGIRTFLKDEMTVQVHNFYSNAIGGVKLQVPEEDVEKALALLGEKAELPPKIILLKENQIHNKTRCPFCGSENISKKKNANWLTLLPFLIIGSILPVYRNSYTCFSCDKQWKIIKNSR